MPHNKNDNKNKKKKGKLITRRLNRRPGKTVECQRSATSTAWEATLNASNNKMEKGKPKKAALDLICLAYGNNEPRGLRKNN